MSIPDPDHALALIDRARAAGITLKLTRGGLTATPWNRLDPNLKAQLSAALDGIKLALRAEKAVRVALNRAKRVMFPLPALPAPKVAA